MHMYILDTPNPPINPKYPEKPQPSNLKLAPYG